MKKNLWALGFFLLSFPVFANDGDEPNVLSVKNPKIWVKAGRSFKLRLQMEPDTYGSPENRRFNLWFSQNENKDIGITMEGNQAISNNGFTTYEVQVPAGTPVGNYDLESEDLSHPLAGELGIEVLEE